MGLKILTNKNIAQNPWAIAIALAITLLIAEGLIAIVWSSTRPKTVLLQDYNDLQTDLTSQLEEQKAEVTDITRKIASAQMQNKMLERDNIQLKQSISARLSLEQLPVQVRGVTPSQCLGKIKAICNTTLQVNQANVSALLAVLVEIQKNGVINTALDAKTPARQTLYRQIQTVLTEIDAYRGPILSDKTSTLAAVKAYQTQSKLKVDGKIGIQTFMTMVQAFQQKRLSEIPTTNN